MVLGIPCVLSKFFQIIIPLAILGGHNFFHLDLELNVVNVN
jgi:hypothetical protein